MKHNGYIYPAIVLFLYCAINCTTGYSSEDLTGSINNKPSSFFIEICRDNSKSLLKEGEEITFYLAASKECNVIMLWMTAGGDIIVLLPNKSHKDFYISKGFKYEIPGFNMEKIKIKGPEGIHRIKAIGTTKNDFFKTFPELKTYDGLTVIKSSQKFLQAMSDGLKKMAADEWTTAELEFYVEENNDRPLAAETPYVPSDIEALLDYKNSTEFYTQGTAYYNAKKYDDAISQFKKVIEISPDIAYGYYSLGLSYQAKGAFKEAIDYYKKCLDHGIKKTDCYLRIGEIYDQLKDKKASALRYKLALHTIEGYEKINDITASDISPEKIYELEIKCKKNPGDREGRMELAVIYEKNNNFKAENYHLKLLLKEALIDYKPCLLEKDKPEIKEPVKIEPVPYIQDNFSYEEAESYTYTEPYHTSYTPPPPPPLSGGPTW